MNTHIYKKEYILPHPLSTHKHLETLDYLLRNIFLSLLLVVILGIIIWIKSRNLFEFGGDYILIGYTAFITLFQLFRLTSALFYKTSLARYKADVPVDDEQEEYEPKVTFVIPCKNEEKVIHNTIEKCFAVPYPEDKMEIIVINDGSTDHTGEVLRRLQAEKFPKLKIISWEKNRGKREGMYAGFKMAKGEIIIQLDSDSYIIPETFREIISPFKNPSIGAVCAHADAENAEDTWVSKMQAVYYYVAFRILKAAESTFGTVFCCSGCSSAFRREAVLPNLDTWLNETFLGQKVTWGDDRALTSYVIKDGYKTIYTDEARAVTIVPTTLRQLIKQQIRWKKSWIINALFTSKFIWRKEPFVAFTYYYPLILISLLTPFVVLRALFYTPLFSNPLSLIFFFLGILVITSLFVVYCKFVTSEYKHWPYMFLWSMFTIFILSFLLFYSLATIQNRNWGTR